MILRLTIGVAAGAAIGFAVGYFGKCASGTCPLTSNPWISMIIGACVGALISAGR